MADHNFNLNLRKVLSVGLCLVAAGTVSSAQRTPLEVRSPVTYRGTVGTPVEIRLTVTGGQAPYTWKVQSRLPDGLKFDSATGLISGAHTTAGEFRVLLEVSDSSVPVQESQVELVLTFVAIVEVKWKQEPRLQNYKIQGSVLVSNNSGRELQFTVIVLAVNGIGKAFALGYEHFDLKPRTDSPVLEFGSALPFGSYITHVDAVAEDLVRKNIYPSRLQTPHPLTLKQE